MELCRCCKKVHKKIQLLSPWETLDDIQFPDNVTDGIGNSSLTWFDDLTESVMKERASKTVTDNANHSLEENRASTDFWSPCPKGGTVSLNSKNLPGPSVDIPTIHELLHSSFDSSNPLLHSPEVKSRTSLELEHLAFKPTDITWTSAMATPEAEDLSHLNESDWREKPTPNGMTSESPAFAVMEFEKRKVFHRKLFSPGQPLSKDDSLSQALDADVTAEGDVTIREEEEDDMSCIIAEGGLDFFREKSLTKSCNNLSVEQSGSKHFNANGENSFMKVEDFKETENIFDDARNGFKTEVGFMTDKQADNGGSGDERSLIEESMLQSEIEVQRTVNPHSEEMTEFESENEAPEEVENTMVKNIAQQSDQLQQETCGVINRHQNNVKVTPRKDHISNILSMLFNSPDCSQEENLNQSQMLVNGDNALKFDSDQNVRKSSSENELQNENLNIEAVTGNVMNDSKVILQENMGKIKETFKEKAIEVMEEDTQGDAECLAAVMLDDVSEAVDAWDKDPVKFESDVLGKDASEDILDVKSNEDRNEGVNPLIRTKTSIEKTSRQPESKGEAFMTNSQSISYTSLNETNGPSVAHQLQSLSSPSVLPVRATSKILSILKTPNTPKPVTKKKVRFSPDICKEEKGNCLDVKDLKGGSCSKTDFDESCDWESIHDRDSLSFLSADLEKGAVDKLNGCIKTDTGESLTGIGRIDTEGNNFCSVRCSSQTPMTCDDSFPCQEDVCEEKLDELFSSQVEDFSYSIIDDERNSFNDDSSDFTPDVMPLEVTKHPLPSGEIHTNNNGLDSSPSSLNKSNSQMVGRESVGSLDHEGILINTSPVVSSPALISSEIEKGETFHFSQTCASQDIGNDNEDDIVDEEDENMYLAAMFAEKSDATLGDKLTITHTIESGNTEIMDSDSDIEMIDALVQQSKQISPKLDEKCGGDEGSQLAESIAKMESSLDSKTLDTKEFDKPCIPNRASSFNTDSIDIKQSELTNASCPVAIVVKEISPSVCISSPAVCDDLTKYEPTEMTDCHVAAAESKSNPPSHFSNGSNSLENSMLFSKPRKFLYPTKVQTPNSVLIEDERKCSYQCKSGSPTRSAVSQTLNFNGQGPERNMDNMASGHSCDGPGEMETSALELSSLDSTEVIRCCERPPVTLNGETSTSPRSTHSVPEVEGGKLAPDEKGWMSKECYDKDVLGKYQFSKSDQKLLGFPKFSELYPDTQEDNKKPQSANEDHVEDDLEVITEICKASFQVEEKHQNASTSMVTSDFSKEYGDQVRHAGCKEKDLEEETRFHPEENDPEASELSRDNAEVCEDLEDLPSQIWEMTEFSQMMPHLPGDEMAKNAMVEDGIRINVGTRNLPIGSLQDSGWKNENAEERNLPSKSDSESRHDCTVREWKLIEVNLKLGQRDNDKVRTLQTNCSPKLGHIHNDEKNLLAESSQKVKEACDKVDGGEMKKDRGLLDSFRPDGNNHFDKVQKQSDSDGHGEGLLVDNAGIDFEKELEALISKARPPGTSAFSVPFKKNNAVTENSSKGLKGKKLSVQRTSFKQNSHKSSSSKLESFDKLFFNDNGNLKNNEFEKETYSRTSIDTDPRTLTNNTNGDLTSRPTASVSKLKSASGYLDLAFKELSSDAVSVRASMDFGGFNTASGKIITISDKAKVKASKIWTDTGESGAELTSVRKFSCDHSITKKDILEFVDSELKESQNFKIMPKNTNEVVCEFTSAGGKKIPLSHTSHKKAMQILESDEVVESANEIHLQSVYQRGAYAKKDSQNDFQRARVQLDNRPQGFRPFKPPKLLQKLKISDKDKVRDRAEGQCDINSNKSQMCVENSGENAEEKRTNVELSSKERISDTADVKKWEKKNTDIHYQKPDEKSSNAHLLSNADSVLEGMEESARSTASHFQRLPSEITNAPDKANNPRCNDGNRNLLSTPRFSSTSASGSGVHISKSGLEEATALFEEENISNVTGKSCENLPGFTAALNSDAHFVGFSMASGSRVKISEKALQKAKTVFDDGSPDDYDHKVFQQGVEHVAGCSSSPVSHEKASRDNFCLAQPVVDEEKCTNERRRKDFNFDAFSGFSTASGSKVKVSENALRHAKRFFDDDDGGDDLKNKRKKGTCEVVNTSGIDMLQNVENDVRSHVEVSENALKFAPTLDRTELEKDYYENFKKKDTFPGFSTANGSKVQVSEDALKHAKTFLDDESGRNGCNNMTNFPGFSTASGSHLEMSEKSLKDVQTILRADMSVSDKVNSNRKSANFSGFSTASGLEVKTSEDALRHAKTFFDGDCSEKTEVPNFVGFSTASGSHVNISKEALRRVQTIFSEEMQEKDPNKVYGSDEFSKSSAALEPKTVSGERKTTLPVKRSHLHKFKVPLRTSCEEYFSDRSWSLGHGKKLVAVQSTVLSDDDCIHPVSSCHTSSMKTAHKSFDCISSVDSFTSIENEKSFGKAPSSYVPPPSTVSSTEAHDIRTKSNAEVSGGVSKFPLFLPQGKASDRMSRNSLKRLKLQSESFSSKSLSHDQKQGLLAGAMLNSSTNERKQMGHHSERNVVLQAEGENGDQTCAKVNCRNSYSPLPKINEQGDNNRKENIASFHSSCAETELNDEEENQYLCKTVTDQENCGCLSEPTGSTSILRSSGETDTKGGIEIMDLMEAGLKQEKIIQTKKRGRVTPLPGRWWNNRVAKVKDARFQDVVGDPEGWSQREKQNLKILYCAWSAVVLWLAHSAQVEGQAVFTSVRKSMSDLVVCVSLARSGSETTDHLRCVLRFGVEESTLNISSRSAAEFRFNLWRFFPSLNTGVLLGDGALLIPDKHGFAGVSEFYRAFLTLDGVDPALVDESWLRNHYRWIVWKLATYEVCYPSIFVNRCLTPEVTMLQLKFRYDREIDKCQRSAIRKIVERDDAALKRMVLCVADIWKAEHQENALELTDGWYSITAHLDVALQDLVERKKLYVGQKLVMSGVELNGIQDGCPPLELPPSAHLKLNFNATRPARAHAELGFCSVPLALCVPLASLHADGGAVGCVDVVVTRKYPLMYMEKCPDKSCVFRTTDEENAARQKAEEHRQMNVEKIFSQIQGEMESQNDQRKKQNHHKWTRKEVEQLLTGSELAEAFDCAMNPEEFEQYLNGTQVNKLMDFKRSQVERRQEEINRKVKEAIASKTSTERIVTTVQKFRIKGCCPYDIDRMCGCLLTVWRPDGEWQEIREGKRYRFFNLSTSASRHNSQSSCKVCLTANRQTRLQPKNISESLLDLVYEPRQVLQISEIREKCQIGRITEFDFLGVALKVTVSKQTGHPHVIHATDSLGDMLCIKFWPSVPNSVSPVKEKDCFVATGLSVRGHNGTRNPSVLLTADGRPEFSTFASSCHSSIAAKQFSKLEQLCKSSSFLSTARSRLEFYLEKQTRTPVPFPRTVSEAYQEDFPPEILDKIFCPMSSQDTNDSTQPATTTRGQQTLVHAKNHTLAHSSMADSSSSLSMLTEPQIMYGKSDNSASTKHHYEPSETNMKRKATSPMEDSVIKKKKKDLQERMGRLLSYGRPSPLSPLPTNAVSPACGKKFKSPKSHS